MIRSNPKYSNICWTRAGTYRDNQCYNCMHLNECDKYYDEETGEFDYPRIEYIDTIRKRNGGAKIKLKVKPGGIYEKDILGAYTKDDL